MSRGARSRFDDVKSIGIALGGIGYPAAPVSGVRPVTLRFDRHRQIEPDLAPPRRQVEGMGKGRLRSE
jgi:hypothetical protein